jgi:hypothetical protein
MTHDGTVRYLDDTLPMCAVVGVGTSRVARKRGLATRVTAEAIAHDVVERDAAIATLGIFDQGFYNRLGFGNGAYEHGVTIDPGDITVEFPARTPIRLTEDDFERVHECRLRARRTHGACSITNSQWTRGDMYSGSGRFGLGFEDESTGELTHHIWCTAENAESGPYDIKWMPFRTPSQFRELTGLVRALGDQVRAVRLTEPPGIQMQDLVRNPFRRRSVSRNTKFETVTKAYAYWQMRMCDVARCVSKLKVRAGADVAFNLVLDDPIARYFEGRDIAERWNGVAGTYRITFGESSHAERVTSFDTSIPTMRTSVNTFTRLWLGVRGANEMRFTSNDFDAPDALIERLAETLHIPVPHTDWEF